MAAEKILREAEFHPNLKKYWILTGCIALAGSFIGIPLIPLWLIFGPAWTGRYIERLRGTLTDRSLQVKRGWFVRVEKTVPLDKITDVGMVQGPIMRYLGIEALSVETAGQSSVGALVRLIGVVDARGFKDAILAERDRIAAGAAEQAATKESATPVPQPPAAPGSEDTNSLLREIRDSLRSIEQKLGER